MIDGGSAAEMSDGVRGWLVFYALATAGTVAIMLANAGGSWPRTIVAVALVLATQAVYLLVARPATATLRGNDRRAWIFAVVAVAAFGGAVVLNPWSTMSLFALTPELFMLFTFGRAAAIIVVLNTVWAAAALAAGPADVNDAVQQIGICLFVVTFSLFFGSRVVAIADRSAERLRLIGQLREREAEVAALSAARGAEQERTRIARDMHDTLAQGFTSIAMLSEAGQAQLRRDGPPELRRTLETISSTARESLAEARSLVASGVPTDVRGGDLLAALQRLPTSMHLAGIRVSIQIPETLPQLSSSHQVALLRTAQEALNNVRRHASATSATVKLRLEASGELRLSIEDNGTGFDPAAASPGFGLRSMAARLAEIGGWLDVASSGAGTLLTAVVPVPAGDAPGAPGTPKPATKEHPA